MEANRNSHRNQEDWQGNEDKMQDMENVDLHIDKDVSGRDIVDENRDDVRHHQQHGNRKYESYRNHSSADDQPMTDTGA